VVVCFLLLGCSALDTLEERKMVEYRWNQVHACSPMFEIPCTFPSWLEDEDKEQVLDALDCYWLAMLELIPESRDFDVSMYTVHIHDNLGAFWVDEAKCWVHGWAIGHHIQIAWSWKMVNGMPNGIAEKNPFDALCHEWLHSIVDQVFGWEDVSHMYFPFFQPLLDMIALGAPVVHLSELSKTKCHLYRYVHLRYRYIE